MAKRERKRLLKKRDYPEFMAFLQKHVSVDDTGKLMIRDCYAHLGFNIGWNGTLVSVTYANLVFFLKKGRWPKPGHHIDHIDDDSLNNRPDNLQEITEAENQAKRRGRKVYRSYGGGKYGYGFNVHHDKRDDRFYVSRNISRGETGGKSKRITFGGFDTRAAAEAKVTALIAGLES